MMMIEVAAMVADDEPVAVVQIGPDITIGDTVTVQLSVEESLDLAIKLMAFVRQTAAQHPCRGCGAKPWEHPTPQCPGWF